MKRIIKITENQLLEADGDAFHYLDANDGAKPFNGQSTITAQGKLNGEENSEPIFTDRIGKQRTAQSWARYRMYGNINKPASTEPRGIYEGVALKTSLQGDANKDGIDDIFTDVASMGQGNGVEALTDGDELNNLTVIPKEVERRIKLLVDSIRENNLNPKKIAMVVNKLEKELPDLGNNTTFIKRLLQQQIDPNDIKYFN